MSIVLTRATKQAARYTDAGGRERCSGCRFFMPQGTCGRIVGPVSPRGWCRFFSQEAVQRWQPQGAIGFGMGPSLALDFMNPGTMPTSLTFTRASTATYFNAAGVMQTAATNVPRWEYDPATGVLRGLLLEDTRTNILLWSTDLTNAAWSLFNGATKGATVTGPDGTLSGMTLNFSTTAASQMFQSASILANMTFSIWARARTSNSFRLRFASDGDSPTLNLTSQWQRFSFTSIGGNSNAAIENVGTTAGSIDIAMPQIEQGPSASSYIPTTTASVTRALDACAIPPANMGWFVSPGGSWFVEVINFTPAPANARVIFVPPAGGSRGPIYIDGTLHAGQFDGATTVVSANTFAVNTVGKIASTLLATTGRICLNGGAVASATMASNYATAAGNGVAFMCATGGATDNTSGYLRGMRYWQRILSDTEMQSITT